MPWLRNMLASTGLVLMAGGVWLLLASSATGWWPRQPVSPLSAQAMAAWLVSIGGAAQAVVKLNDLTRVGATPSAFVAVGVLAAVALARFRQSVTWAAPTTWRYLLVLAACLTAGVRGLRAVVRPGSTT